MTRRVLLLLAILVFTARIASAHRLDEYLQATILSVDNNRLEASMRLIPGVAVAPAVIAAIDTNHDGVFSPEEQTAYANRILAGLAIGLDGHAIHPTLATATFPTPEQMTGGIGEIHIDFTATLPVGGQNRRLTLESHRLVERSVYLVNALAPTDPNIRILAQTRNEDQTAYQLDYVQTGAPTNWFQNLRASIDPVTFANLFHLGIRHIAEGTDHLLFLLALLLPAPLIAAAGRWTGPATVRTSLLRILKIVTAFTIGHSITLALAALGVVTVPSHPIEVLIAVSIFLSAIHAFRPIFPGKEAGIAAFFGLIHGLAFAATLTNLGLGRWERLQGILAFNLGIETMQLCVVAATMPSLLLLSRTRAYPAFRVAGAIFAAVASAGWIVERLLNRTSTVDVAVDAIAHHAPWLAALLFLGSVFAARKSLFDKRFPEPMQSS